MAFDQNRSFGPRPMVQGNWKCAQCGADVTELPFSPREGSDVFCRDCYRNKKRF